MARKTRKARKVRSLRFPVSTFVAQHKDALDAGLTLHEFAKKAGMSYTTVCMRMHALRKRGIVLPRLKHGLTGVVRKPKASALTAPKQVVVPAGQTVRIDNGSDSPITITIEGGNSHA